MDQAKDAKINRVKRISDPPRMPSSDSGFPRPRRVTTSNTRAAVEATSAGRSGASGSSSSLGAAYISAKKATSAPNAIDSIAPSLSTRDSLIVPVG